jgi:WD40 repeat protein
MAYDNWVSAVAFSPDGHWLVHGGGDRLAQVWLSQPKDLIDEACARLTRNLTRSEWQQYLGDEPYRPTCPNLPMPEE